ncbi:hypothetical protein T265_05425 [Opisthorchis viverrini]|uniref:Uncharacterized protein n=1 Tax=Opisthorchis viverrini TaxID=6198 RepID=A0A074ZKG7_OPIVI|nr:hypothetical protein T265_05425 [Opisthorchis viverrini]KER27536.1 hypothetical protein T265_05425 [Opisthorchis viverrini]
MSLYEETLSVRSESIVQLGQCSNTGSSRNITGARICRGVVLYTKNRPINTSTLTLPISCYEQSNHTVTGL